ncbi:MAG: hypothetical protein AVDCRST_MAG68-1327 [uncultured Gemmatimonadetes bacterium]|uniref:Bacterial surface antigen (D15) domain-containing protein n=1 Tax=uncultured Gemmatimonadota bacterium TaxID=203437 RepID=A0A6J4KSY6_9BACT|nr:MAG: hypothetical protein AVDCRST_MAG68-1327 [uncultured Gemmatimonadota bacterium]
MRFLYVLALLLAAIPLHAQDDAYRDPRARELVRLARARRAVVDDRITAYEVTARERISARLAVLGTERLLFRRETAARIEWSRDTVNIELLGAREAAPVVSARAQLPSPDIASSVTALAFDPADSEMLIRLDSATIRNPLSPGSEAYYRFAAGDSLSIRIPGGRVVRILELRITARRADPHLINGSFWLDSETHAVVRAGFRQSRPYSSTATGISVIAPEVGGELDYVAIDYGLWDRRWWLPRTVAARGVARVGGTRLPLTYERRYEGYRVQGDTLAALPAQTASPARPECRRRVRMSVTVRTTERSDTAWDAAWRREAERVAKGDSTDGGPACGRTFLVKRAEGVDLVGGPSLPASIYDAGEGAVREEDLKALTDLIGGLEGTPWSVGRPSVQVLTPELVRFNRVEGLSLGARAVLPLGPAELRGELRAGTTDEVGARLAGIHSTPLLRREVALYRGLEAVQMGSQPFTLGSSLSALLLGRDENDYFRGTGAELRLSPAATRRQRWDLRLFAEHQGPVGARSDLNLRGAFDDDFEPRSNLMAERLDQAGATFRIRAARGDDPTRLRTHAELELHAETGGRSFARPLVRLGAEGLIGGGVGYGLSVAGGSGLGDVPVQRLWQIGGVTTVRGHDAASLRGKSVWLTRAELTRGTPLFRLSLFGDAGWAGDSVDILRSHPLKGVGVGLAFLDNLVRVDLARGLGTGGGYGLHLRVGGGI